MEEGGRCFSEEKMGLLISTEIGLIIKMDLEIYRENEFWLGLDKIHLLTSNNTTLRVDLRDFSSTAYAQYSTFTVGSESSKYILNVAGYSGTAGDSLVYHNSMKFTTRDRDNDNHGSLQCADHRRGGWWYNACSYSNLNGLYLE